MVTEDLKATDDASAMNVDIIDLCEESDGSPRPSATDTSGANTTIPSTPESSKSKTSDAPLSADNVIYFNLLISFLLVFPQHWYYKVLHSSKDQGMSVTPIRIS